MSDNCYWVGEVGCIQACVEGGPTFPVSGNFIQRAQLIVDGSSVAIDYETAMVLYSDSGTKIKVYTRTGNAWAETDILTATYLSGLYAVSGDYAVFRAYWSKGGGDYDGGVYVFKRTAPGIWTEHQVLWLANPLNISVFCIGANISEDGQWMMMARDDGFANEPGQVEVYSLVNGSYAYHSTINEPSGDLNSRNFGSKISISDNGYAIIGHESDDNNGSNSGLSHIFALSGGVWGWIQTLNKATYVSSDHYGSQVDITPDGTKVAIADDRGITEIWDGGPAVFVRDFNDYAGTIGSSSLAALSNDGLTMVRVFSPYSGAHTADIFELSGTWAENQSITPNHSYAGADPIQIGSAAFGQGNLIISAAAFDGEMPSSLSEVFIYSRDPL